MSGTENSKTITNWSRVTIETLGCKVNLFESEYIRSQLESHNASAREICIINTCTVTQEASRQSRQAIRKAIRMNPDATIVVTGCYAEMEPDTCANISGVDLVVPGSQKLQIPDILGNNNQQEHSAKQPETQINLPGKVIPNFESRTRSYVQIQQGCDNGCTFCIIHKARGESRSVLPTTVKNQVEKFIESGSREIVLCGIDLGSYGADLSSGLTHKMNLSVLLRELAESYTECHFRLSSIDPAHIDKSLIDTMSACENICPHIHLSLQSAASIILKRMKRRYSPDDVYQVVDLLRRHLPDLVLSADILTGFPTESDDDFELTRQAIYNLEIAFPHVFPYSERNGTPAARIPKQVPVPVRKLRAMQIRAAGEEVKSQVLNRYINRRTQALIETTNHKKTGMIRARMANYLPVYLNSTSIAQSGWVNVHIHGTTLDGLHGSVLS